MKDVNSDKAKAERRDRRKRKAEAGEFVFRSGGRGLRVALVRDKDGRPKFDGYDYKRGVWTNPLPPDQKEGYKALMSKEEIQEFFG